jgi:hypothetical protein
MTRRELEQWVEANGNRLVGRGVHALFSFGPSVGSQAGSSWVSFVSARGSGRLVRGADGVSRVDAYGFADGACLRRERATEVSTAQLESLVDTLASGR